MKRFYIYILLLITFSFHINAQNEIMNIYRNGQVIFSSPIADIDSISFQRRTVLKPTVSTKFVSYSSYAEAIIRGTVTSDGGDPIIERGICWGTSKNPTISNNKIIDNGNSNLFNLNIKEKTIDVTYYARAYAKNSIGVSYGEQISFISGYFSDLDGNVYSSVRIGDQIWMKQNLRTTKYSNGDPIPSSSWANNNADGKYAKSNHPNTLTRYGNMYNWYTAIDWRNPCPAGWRVPSSDDWRSLISLLGGSSVAGKKLKSDEKSTYNWSSFGSSVKNTNETGFSAYPNGYLSLDGLVYQKVTEQGHFWTSNEGRINFSYYGVSAVLYYDSDKAVVDNYTKSLGKAIRCICEQE